MRRREKIVEKISKGTYVKLLLRYVTYFVCYEVFRNDIFNAVLKSKKRSSIAQSKETLELAAKTGTSFWKWVSQL
jgi:hypothetical protein